MLAVPALICSDPAPTSPVDPTLLRLLAEARSQSLDLAQSAARLEVSRVAARAAGADRRPLLDGTSEVDRRRNSRDGELAPAARTTYRSGLESTWELDLWGRLRQVRNAAEQDVRAAEADLHGARLLLEAEVVKAYQDLRYVQGALELQTQRVAAFGRVLAIQEARQQAGLTAGTERFRAETDLRQTEAEAQASRRELIQIRHRLALLLGRGTATQSDLEVMIPIALPDLPQGLSSETLASRPDLEAATRRQAAAQARVGEAQAARLPRITLTGAYGFASAELKDLARSDSVTWSLTPRLSLPLFDGGRSRARIEAARAEVEVATATLRQIQQRALLEVAEGLATLEEDLQIQARWAAAAVGAERTLVARSAERQAGRTTGLATTEAELQLLAVRLQCLGIARSRDHTQVALRLALGWGWLPNP